MYFYTFEDGVNLDFERTINRGNVIGVDDACKSLTLNYTYGNRDWEINYDRWEQQNTIYIPKDTIIYVSPDEIGEGYGFNFWDCNDANLDNITLYTIDEKENLITEVQGPVVEGKVSFSQDMAFRYSQKSYPTGKIYLNLSKEGAVHHVYTVSYDANDNGDASGSVKAQTFDEYFVYIRNNGFTREGYTFTGWNTKDDGTGTPYSPNEIYGDGENEKVDVILHAQWTDSGTDPGDEPAIETFDKELVESAAGVPADLKTGDYDFPVGGTVTVPVNDEVTLLYMLTVHGKPNANYTITDDDVKVESGSLSDTLDADGNAVVYVTKTFAVGDFTEDDKLVNSATITTTTDGGVAPGEGEAEAETGAEEGAPVPPTEDELEKLLDEGAVLIHCTTAEYDHPELLSGLIEGSYSYEEVTGTAESASVTMKVNSAKYVEAYEAANGGKDHWLNVGETDPETISFTWTKENGWQVAPAIPVVFTVTCEGDAWFNSSEFHIMHLADIQKAVAEAAGLDSAEDVEIYTIYVQGTHHPVFDEDEVSQATGGIDAFSSIAGANSGVHGTNGMLVNSDSEYSDRDAWKVLNTVDIIDDNTVTGITIYYKVSGDNTEQSVEIPCTDFESVNRLTTSGLLGLPKHITQIWLDVEPDDPTPEPEPEPYTLTITVENGTVTDNGNPVILTDGTATI